MKKQLHNAMMAVIEGKHKEANEMFSEYVNEKTKSMLNESGAVELPQSARKWLKDGQSILTQSDIDDISDDELRQINRDFSNLGSLLPRHIRISSIRVYNALVDRDNDSGKDDEMDDESHYGRDGEDMQRDQDERDYDKPYTYPDGSRGYD